MSERDRRLQSLLDLGKIIGLDLNLKEMLTQIAQKACEVMQADRCTLFLYDPDADELWSTVALGMGEQVIRIPSKAGLAGHCFQTDETVNLRDAYADPRFNREVDKQTGYHTRSLLCMPIHNRSGDRIGVIQLLNKKEGAFDEEDQAFLKTFGNHASIFIQIAQLQQARIEALERSQKELELLNRAKSKALDHLSHELRTPLSVIQGNLLLLKRKFQTQASPGEGEKFFEALEKNLHRLSEIQQETDKMIRSYQESEREHIVLLSFAERILEKARRNAAHRELHYYLEGVKDLSLSMAPDVLEDIVGDLLKNAIENTPDEGTIQIIFERKNGRILLKVRDSGIGITEDNQKQIFDGLFHTLDTELYTSKKPYDFGAGGKGLDLLRIKIYGQRLGFNLWVESKRCIYLPTDRDLCPGRISACRHCQEPKDCQASGGSTFWVSFLPTELAAYRT